METLFVQPHPDDVALSLGGMVALTRSSRILTLFAEPPAAGAPLSVVARRWHERWGTAEDTWSTRRGEDVAAAEVLGAECEWLPYCDAIYRGERYPTFASLTGAVHPDDAPLAATIAADLIARWKKSGGGMVYLPLGAGRHVDHQLCHSLGAPLAAAGATVRYYEDFPYVLVDGALEDRLGVLGAAGATFTPETIDISATVDKRVAAIEAYRSQVGVLFRMDGSYPGPCEAAVKRYATRVAPAGGTCGERTWARA